MGKNESQAGAFFVSQIMRTYSTFLLTPIVLCIYKVLRLTVRFKPFNFGIS